MAKKNNIDVKLMEGNSTEEKPSKQSKKPKNKEVQDMRGLLISRVSHPTYIKYGEEEIRLSGRSQVMVADYTLLGELGRGIFLKPLAKK